MLVMDIKKLSANKYWLSAKVTRTSSFKPFNLVTVVLALLVQSWIDMDHSATLPPLAQISEDCYSANLTLLSHGEKSERWNGRWSSDDTERHVPENKNGCHLCLFGLNSFSPHNLVSAVFKSLLEVWTIAPHGKCESGS